MPGSISLVTRSKTLRFGYRKKFQKSLGNFANQACLIANYRQLLVCGTSFFRRNAFLVAENCRLLKLGLAFRCLFRIYPEILLEARVVICNEVSYESKSFSPVLFRCAVSVDVLRNAIVPVTTLRPRSNCFRTLAEHQRKYASFGSIH